MYQTIVVVFEFNYFPAFDIPTE